MFRYSPFWHLISSRPPRPTLLWPLLGLVALIASFLAWQLITAAVEKRSEELIDGLYDRADSLTWAIEGASRIAAHGRHVDNLSYILSEMGQSPGIAWLALLTPNGRILADSNPDLVGQELYTPAEMNILDPGPKLHGRFSPDDINIYETWRIFSPGRVMGRHHPARPEAVIFVALNASNFRADLADYQKQLRLTAIFIISALLAAAALVFYMQSYGASKKNLENTIMLTKQIIGNYPDPLLVIFKNGEVAIYNNAAAKLFGNGKLDRLSINKLGGYDWKGIFIELERGAAVREKEIDLVWPGKPPLPASVSAALVLSAKGLIYGYLLIIRNLEEISRLKRQLAESRRMATLGNLASGLAHEIRNPLSSIRGYATYLATRLENDPLGLTTANILVEETQRLDLVLNDLLHIARPKKIHPQTMDMSAVIQRAAAILKPDADAKNIKIALHLPQKAPATLDANAILQVVLNLLLNAIQILPNHGKIEIMLQAIRAGNGELPAELRDEDSWRIEIHDNGPGIKAEIIDDIFTPYFTTRPNGTGLGLPVARQIIFSHSGVLTVSSQQNHGTTFTIFLPQTSHVPPAENSDS